MEKTDFVKKNFYFAIFTVAMMFAVSFVIAVTTWDSDPTGKATHGNLYADNIGVKSADATGVHIQDTLYCDGGIDASCGDGVGADNLGDHTATQNIVLGSFWLSNDGGNDGISIDSDGDVGIGTDAPEGDFEIEGPSGQDLEINLDSASDKQVKIYFKENGVDKGRLTVGGAFFEYYDYTDSWVGSFGMYEGEFIIGANFLSNTLSEPRPKFQLHVDGSIITKKYHIDCPDGFTSVESQGRQLGCIQDEEQSFGASCKVAQQGCFNDHGGRLPTYGEILVAFVNYDLTDETDDEEWVDGSYRADGVDKCSTISDDAWKPSGKAWSTELDYRCWIDT